MSGIQWEDAEQLALHYPETFTRPGPKRPAALREGMRYAVLDGGKRLRPLLVLAAYEAVRGRGPDNPADADAALDVRMLDRFFANYVSTPQQKVVFDALCAEADRHPHGVRKARAMLETSYAWLDARMATRTWACGGASGARGGYSCLFGCVAIPGACCLRFVWGGATAIRRGV